MRLCGWYFTNVTAFAFFHFFPPIKQNNRSHQIKYNRKRFPVFCVQKGKRCVMFRELGHKSRNNKAVFWIFVSAWNLDFTQKRDIITFFKIRPGRQTEKISHVKNGPREPNLNCPYRLQRKKVIFTTDHLINDTRKSPFSPDIYTYSLPHMQLPSNPKPTWLISK